MSSHVCYFKVCTIDNVSAVTRLHLQSYFSQRDLNVVHGLQTMCVCVCVRERENLAFVLSSIPALWRLSFLIKTNSCFHYISGSKWVTVCIHIQLSVILSWKLDDLPKL